MVCVAQLPSARLVPTSSSRAVNAVPSAVAARAGRPLQPAAVTARQQRQRRRQQQRQRGSTLPVRALRNIDWPEALLFDCDGVLVDTEAEGHRVAFNAAFKRKGALPSRCVVLACRCPSLLQRGLVGKSWPFMLLGLRSSECLSR